MNILKHQHSNTGASFQYTYDGTSPTMLISSDTVDSGDVTGDAPITISFAVTDSLSTTFEISDVTISGGTLGALSSDSMTSVVTPTADGVISISVASNRYVSLIRVEKRIAQDLFTHFVARTQFSGRSRESERCIEHVYVYV